MRALTIKHTYYKVVGWVGVAFFMICTLGSWSAGAGRTSLIFLGFVVLCSYLILNSGSMQVDSDPSDTFCLSAVIKSSGMRCSMLKLIARLGVWSLWGRISSWR